MEKLCDRIRPKVHALLRRLGLRKVPRKTLVGVIGLCLILATAAAVRFWPVGAEAQEESFELESAASEQDAEPAQTIAVDVEGAVVSPGLYELDAGARAGDAVEAAGGLADDAQEGAVNLAQVLEDGQQLYVPHIGEGTAAASEGDAPATSAPETGKVNINTAGIDKLQTLDGIGQVLAQRIVDYRSQNGPFSSVDDIQEVSGIGQGRYDAIKDAICI